MQEFIIDAADTRTRILSLGSGSPVLLIHGFHGSADHYRWLAPQLGERLGTHSVDLLGHGETDWPASGYRISDYGRHVLAVLDALELPSAAVLGNSLGGAVAMWMAINAPERVSSLVLLGPAGLGGTTRVGAAQFVLGLAEVALGVRTRAVAGLSKRIQFADASSVDPAFFESKERDARRRRRGHHRKVTMVQSRRLARMHPVDPSLIRQPTLVLWGEDDGALDWRKAGPASTGSPTPASRSSPGAATSPRWSARSAWPARCWGSSKREPGSLGSCSGTPGAWAASPGSRCGSTAPG